MLPNSRTDIPFVYLHPLYTLYAFLGNPLPYPVSHSLVNFSLYHYIPILVIISYVFSYSIPSSSASFRAVPAGSLTSAGVTIPRRQTYSLQIPSRFYPISLRVSQSQFCFVSAVQCLPLVLFSFIQLYPAQLTIRPMQARLRITNKNILLLTDSTLTPK